MNDGQVNDPATQATQAERAASHNGADKVREVSTSPRHQAAERVLASAAEGLNRLRDKFGRPSLGGMLTGAAVLGVGTMWGVTEALLTGAVAWVLFRAVVVRRPPPRHSDVPSESASG